MAHNLSIYKFVKKGKLNLKYNTLQNFKNKNTKGFTTDKLTYTLKNFVDINTQLSYDDSINLIINDGLDIPRIINTGFRTTGDKNFEYLVRNQYAQTNSYNTETINKTDLFLRSTTWPIINLHNVIDSGQLMGGNYVFYIKYCDEDFNETEVVSESGIVSIYKNIFPSVISGSISDERVNKSIELHITNFDRNFSHFYIYFSRETCDNNGLLITKYYKISDFYEISENNIITISGHENIEEINKDTLFLQYNYFTSAKTAAITQNMLFLGNVKTSERNYPKLQQLSYRISVAVKQRDESIGYITSEYPSEWTLNNEYYNPKNTYYYLGYWPEEYYSIGISYILSDGTITNSFPLLGRKLELDEVYNENIDFDKDLEINKLLDYDNLKNTGGIFKLPKVEIIKHNTRSVNPLYFEFKLTTELLKELDKLNVIGYFFTRNKRIPVSLFQGLSIGVDKESGTPLIYSEKKFISESFLNSECELSPYVDEHIKSTSENMETYGLLSLDPIINKSLSSQLYFNEFSLFEEYDCEIKKSTGHRGFKISKYNKINTSNNFNCSLIYVPENTPSLYINNFYFSTRAGNAESAKEFSFLFEKKLDEDNSNILRGVYNAFIGTNKKLNNSSIYTVKNKIDEISFVKSLINNKSEYFAITNRFKLQTDKPANISAYRGDCFTNTVTMRINKNFIDSTVPFNDTIVDKNTWKDNYNGYEESDTKWDLINISDLNAVPLGLWITFKCLSNYNLGFRSLNYNHPDFGKLSIPESFYPLNNFDASSKNKVFDSDLLNEGYSITLSRNSYNKWIPTPYENWNFENRIAFSNIASTKMFTNGFRIFQGMAYQDVDKQFGQIIKLFPYGQNLLCVFEHGLAIVPINEKALLSTQEGLSIHLYGAGVLQEQVSVISPDYGSTWAESLIKTPNAYYGVDTHAKKIWKFNSEGFTCISDFKIQSFLNEELNIDWNDKFLLGATNVRTHYNNFKGDVIFTFYNKGNAYSICYNELTKMWVSKYTWMPLLSANIDNHFYSFNQKDIAKYSNILQYASNSKTIICKNPFWDNDNKYVEFEYVGILPATLALSSINVIDKDNLNEEIDLNDYLTNFICINENTYKLFIPEDLQYVGQLKITIDIKYNDKFTETSEFIIDKIDNYNESLYLYEHKTDSPITKWYNNQEPFEYEFIVNQPSGFHKIFNNLMIISNNVEPDSLEVEIVGDVYDFKEEFISQNENIKYKFPIISITENKIYQTKLTLDKVSNEHRLLMHQDCLNIKDFGRRLGNISYIEGKWYIVLQPIYYEDETLKTTRLRDKWAKIRIKYSGEKLAIITAIQTLMNISYV